MLIDFQDLSEEALYGVVQQFVMSQLSEADDELHVEQWISQTVQAVKQGELVIEFSEVDESVYIKRKEDVNLSGNTE